MTAEHYFQAAKTTDIDEARDVLSQLTPGGAKRAGAKVTLRPDWDSYRVEAMEAVLRYKFEDPRLRAKLVATGDAELVEANTWNDRYWGVDSDSGTGHNMLGILLMKLRREYADVATD